MSGGSRMSNKSIKPLNIKKVSFAVICVVIGLVFVGASLHGWQTYSRIGIKSDYDIPIGEITAGTKIQQSLPVDNSIIRVSILFATWARVNSGMVDVQITGCDSGTIYVHEQLEAANMDDNTYVDFDFIQNASSGKDQRLEIAISSDSVPGQAVTCWSSAEDSIENATLQINGVEKPGDLAIKTFVINHDSDAVKLYAFKTVIIGVSILLVLGTVWALLWKKWVSYETLFAALVFFFGLLYIFTITIISAPDEQHHYHSAYQLSNYILLQGDTAEQWNSAAAVADYYTGHKNTSAGYLHLLNDIFAIAESGELMTIPFPRKLSYFVEYLAPAIGIALARILNLNFVCTFLLGRLMNLSFFTACVYLAVKRIPRFKLVLGLIAMFPITLQQAASYSYDAFINGIAFLLIASLFKAIWEEGLLSRKDYLYIFICSVLLAPAKIVYTLISLLIWFIPRERFPSKKDKTICCG